MFKKITSFTKFTTGEGTRIAFTFSTMDEKGQMIATNQKAGFILLDKEVQAKIEEIEKYIDTNYLTQTE